MVLHFEVLVLHVVAMGLLILMVVLVEVLVFINIVLVILENEWYKELDVTKVRWVNVHFRYKIVLHSWQYKHTVGGGMIHQTTNSMSYETKNPLGGANAHCLCL